MSEYFLRPYLVVVLVVLIPIIYGWARRQITLRHPSLAPHKGMRTGSILLIAAYACLSLMTVNLDIALMGPKVPDAVVQHLAVIRKACIFVDRSGSMETVLNDGVKDLTDDEAKAVAKNDPTAVRVDNGGSDKLNVQSTSPAKAEAPHPLTRIEAAQLAARYVIRHRMTDNPDETDQFCLMSFDDDTYMMAPLSNDKQVLLLRTAHITENVGGGTNFAGPYGYNSGIGPLQKELDYMAANSGPNTVAVDIIITDGEDSIPEDRARQLLAQYEQKHIHFYVIGLGDSWKKGNSLDLQKFADALHAKDKNNGLVFQASNPGAMTAAMEKINQLEKAQEIVENRQNYKEIYPYFLLAAGVFGALFIGLAMAARRVP